MSLCQDPRDKLFGILGLSSDLIEGEIEVNYNTSLFSLLCSVVSNSQRRSSWSAGVRDVQTYGLVKLCQAI